MKIASIAARIAVVLAALAVVYLAPVIAEGPNGRTYDLLWIAVDVLALAAIVLVVAWTMLRGRRAEA